MASVKVQFAVSRMVGSCARCLSLSLAVKLNQECCPLNLHFFWATKTVRSGPRKYHCEGIPTPISSQQASRAQAEREKGLLLRMRTCSLPSSRPLLKCRIQFKYKRQFHRLFRCSLRLGSHVRRCTATRGESGQVRSRIFITKRKQLLKAARLVGYIFQPATSEASP